MKHIIKDGSNENLFILLHGTGGDAESLFPILRYLDPEATGVGIQGEVVESGMNRYFARNSDGSFDLASLAEATTRLYQTIEELRTRNDLKDKRVILAGYSNGANIIQSLLKDHSTDYRLALIFHPSLTRGDESYRQQKDMKVLITSGANDPYITEEAFLQVERSLKDAGIPTEVFSHDKGHSLIPAELDKARDLVRALSDRDQ